MSLIAAGLLFHEGKILLGQRALGGDLPLFWEFPIPQQNLAAGMQRGTGHYHSDRPSFMANRLPVSEKNGSSLFLCCPASVG